MATGILGTADVVADTDTTVYTVPSAKVATVNVSICNRNNSPIRVRLAMAASGTPGASEWIEYDTILLANGVLERTALVLEATKRIVIRTDTSSVSVVAYGFEE